MENAGTSSDIKQGYKKLGKKKNSDTVEHHP